MDDKLLVGHVGESEEVAEAYLYLMRQTYGTGETLVVDGGGASVTMALDAALPHGDDRFACSERSGHRRGEAARSISRRKVWHARDIGLHRPRD